MMMSLSAALRCMAVIKHRSNCLHFWPAQSSLRASSLDHAVLDSGSVFELGAVTGFGGRLPFADDVELRTFIKPAENGLALRVVNLLAAKVVASPFHVADGERAVQDAVEATECL